MVSLALIGLLATPLAASPVIYVIGRLGNRRGTNVAQFLAALALGATWLALISVILSFQKIGIQSFTVGALSLRLDGLSLLLAAVTLSLGSMVVIFSGPYMAGESGYEKFFAMLVAMIGVIIDLGCASDLFNLWIWFEAMAVTSYLLVAFYRDQSSSLEAGVKYLVQSAAGSTLVLVAIGLVLSKTGTLDLDQIASLEEGSSLLLAAGALFVIGFGVKTAIVPMHTWLPDAHAQAPSGISAMLSGVVIEAGLIAMLRSICALTGLTPQWGPLLMAFGALNMSAGNLMALRQQQVKRLLAYSSLAHIGYMLAGLGITFYSGVSSGAQGSFFHLLNHALMKGLAFLSAGSLLYGLHIANGKHTPLLISDLYGTASKYPIAAFTLSIAVLSLGGLPPLAGFMSKWQIFISGFATHNGWIAALVAFAGLNSVLSLAYYAPLVNAMYRNQPSAAVTSGQKQPRLMSLPMLILAIAIVLLGVWPTLAEGLTASAGIVVTERISLFQVQMIP